MKCHICKTINISQDEADEASEINGGGFDTMCKNCAQTYQPEAFHSGYEAFKQNDHVNPYLSNTFEFKRWAEGYACAKNE